MYVNPAGLAPGFEVTIGTAPVICLPGFPREIKGIFDAHLLVVEDRTLIDEVLRTLARDKTNVEHVFQNVAGRYAKTLSEIDDPYLRERALDIHDVTRRVVRNLMGKESRDLASIIQII